MKTTKSNKIRVIKKIKNKKKNNLSKFRTILKFRIIK